MAARLGVRWAMEAHTSLVDQMLHLVIVFLSISSKCRSDSEG